MKLNAAAGLQDGSLRQCSAMTPGGFQLLLNASCQRPDESRGYRSLRSGQKVEATIKGPLDFEQDGYRYTATAVWLLD
jgi:hypothetical protein